MRSYADACKLLDISDNSEKDTIKKAYHKLALKHHPDKGGDAEAFRKVSEAYRFLMEYGDGTVERDLEDLEDWENFDPMVFFKEQFSQNDMFVMVQDYGLFENILESTDMFGTLFSNIGGIMMDQDKIFNLANTLIGDDGNVIFNTLKSTHAFAKDLGSKIKDVSVNVNAKLKDIYSGRVVRVSVKCRRFDGENLIEHRKKVPISLRYQRFKLPNEGHQMAPGSKVYGDAVFDVRIKDYLDTVYRFNQDDIFVEAAVGKWQQELTIEWADLTLDIELWKQNVSKIVMLEGYGFYKNQENERGTMYIHIVYDESIDVPKMKERETDDDDEVLDVVEIKKEYSLILFKNLLL